MDYISDKTNPTIRPKMPIHVTESRSDPRSNAKRPKDLKRILGQYFTPATIADKMVDRLLVDRQARPVRLLDPCVGEASFLKSVYSSGYLGTDDIVDALDIDRNMIEKTSKWSSTVKLNINTSYADYLETDLSNTYDFIIQNPPYVRQEWLDNKTKYQNLFKEKYDAKIPGTSNLYVYFIVKMIQDLKPGGGYAAIIYDAWQSTKYGKWLSEYLYRFSSKLDVEIVANQPFDGRLIDATIIYGKKANASNKGVITSVNSSKLSALSNSSFFSRMDDLFHTKRGLRLKQANFFLCNRECVEKLGATPFIKKISKIKGFEVTFSDSDAALIVQYGHESKLVENELNLRLLKAKSDPSSNETILNWFRERPHSWFYHHAPPKAPLLFNYYLRNRPKHILSNDISYSDNFYGLTPKFDISIHACLALLNSTAVALEVLDNARNQGNGLAKIQLYEYREAILPDIRKFPTYSTTLLSNLGHQLISNPDKLDLLIGKIDKVIYETTKEAILSPARLPLLYQEVDHKSKIPKS